MSSLDNRLLLTTNTSTIADTFLAIEGYLAIDKSGRAACKASTEIVDNHHLEQVVSALSTPSVVLASQSETLATVMAWLEAMELASKTKTQRLCTVKCLDNRISCQVWHRLGAHHRHVSCVEGRTRKCFILR